MKEPLLAMIQRSLDEHGRLEQGFTLPQEGEDKLPFADGARDGIFLYHTNMGNGDASLAIQAVDAAAEGNYREAWKLSEEFAETQQTLLIIDEVQQHIAAQAEQVDAENVQRFALELMVYGRLREQVKLGMAVMELFDVEEEVQYRKIIRELSASDEFTLYGTYLARAWEDASEELFMMAQRVRGWGRIHAINALEPEYDEMEEWLLEEGVENEILPAYSALDCYEKSQMIKRLKGGMNEVQFDGACRILKALLEEGPVEGISAVEDERELFRLWRLQAERHDLTPQQQEMLEAVEKYEED